jgi:hypothetical protein
VLGAAHKPLQRRRIGSLPETLLKPADPLGQLRDQAFGVRWARLSAPGDSLESCVRRPAEEPLVGTGRHGVPTLLGSVGTRGLCGGQRRDPAAVRLDQIAAV